MYRCAQIEGLRHFVFRHNIRKQFSHPPLGVPYNEPAHYDRLFVLYQNVHHELTQQFSNHDGDFNPTDAELRDKLIESCFYAEN